MPFPKLFEKRMMLWPTKVGMLCIALALVSPAALWGFFGDRYLACSDTRASKGILVVEGWISGIGIKAAADEFRTGNYDEVVAAGSYSAEQWNPQRWNFAVVAKENLIRYGVEPSKIVFAPARDVDSHRTFETALAVSDAVHSRPGKSKCVTIFTRGMHARRSRAVYSKVLGPEYQVQVISWWPSAGDSNRWWQSSERAKDFIMESIAWAYELLLDSGRSTTHADNAQVGRAAAP